MTKEEADKIYGPVVFKDENFAVRALVKEGGLWIVGHRISGTEEIVPRAYMLGTNVLIMKGKKS
jgi:hypothetical protein